jgi:hypothetical protein
LDEPLVHMKGARIEHRSALSQKLVEHEPQVNRVLEQALVSQHDVHRAVLFHESALAPQPPAERPAAQ